MKKIGLIILGSFMLLSSVALSCPDKKFHSNAVALMEKLGTTVYIERDTMYVRQKELILKMIILYPKDDKLGLEVANGICEMLIEYCQNHDLEFEILK